MAFRINFCCYWIYCLFKVLLEVNNIKKQVILLLGLGLGNQAILKFLKKYSFEYYIYDDNLLEYNQISLEIRDKIECVLKSSGIPNEHFLITYFKEKKIKIITDLEFYYLYRIYHNHSIIITGSNGKSTTVKLIKHLIEDIDLAGNIGDPIGNYLESNKPIVIEASSYMAEYCHHCEANVLGYINIYPNHLRHHKSFNNYLQSKKNLINNKDQQLIFINSKDYKYFNSGKQIIFYDSLMKYLNIDFLYYDNAILAINIALNYGINLETILKRLKYFQFLEHRLENFYQYNKISFINDSKSTNFIALNYALNQFVNQNILLIVGGKSKNKEEVIHLDNINGIKLILINGENRYLIKREIDKNKIENYLYDNLELLINDLDKYLDGIDVVLFSPGSESFDQFKNFEERGTKFKEKVLKKFKSMVY